MQVNTNSRIVIGALSVAVALGLLAPLQSHAQAFSAQNFHGNICQVNSEIVSKVRYTESGIKALSNLTVRCPLVTVSREITHIGVNVKETSLSSTLCLISAVAFTGSLQASIPLVIPGGSRSTNVPIPESAKGPTTFYTVDCKMPAEQTLTSINVTRP